MNRCTVEHLAFTR